MARTILAVDITPGSVREITVSGESDLDALVRRYIADGYRYDGDAPALVRGAYRLEIYY